MTHTDTVPASIAARLFSAAGPRVVTWLLCFAVLGVVFLPVFVIPYAHHDQYRHFRDAGADTAFKQTCSNDPQYRYLYLLGRPIAAETECVIFEHTTRLSDLIVFRLWVVALLALAATSYAELLYKGLGTVASVALSLAIFTLPGAQNAVFMTNLANVLAPLLATLSYLSLDKAQEQYERRRKPRAAAWAGLAAALLLAAFLTYAFLALFFFCATVAWLLFGAGKGWRSQAGRLLRDGAFAGVVVALFWSIAKFALFPRDPATIAHIPAAYRPFLDIGGIPGRVAYLLKEISPNLALWYVYPFRLLSGCVLVVICVGFLLYLWRGNQEAVSNWYWHRLLAALAIVLLIIASFGPFLLIPAPFLYRLFFSTGAMIVMLLFWSAAQIIVNTGLVRFFHDGGAGKWIGIAICAAGCGFAAINTMVNTENSFLEFAYIKAQLAATRDVEIQRVHIVQPRPGSSFNGLPPLADEFNRPTTTYWFDVTYMVRAALTEMRVESKYVVDGSDWIAKGNSRKACEIRTVTGSHIRISDEAGTSSDAIVENRRILVSGGRVPGVVAPDLRVIRWDNGAIWSRRDDSYRAGLEGSWTMLDAYANREMIVTTSQAGEPVLRSPNMVVIDMNILLDSVQGWTGPSQPGR